jgi:hypothetical protein
MEKPRKRVKIPKTAAISLKHWWLSALMASETYLLAHAFRQDRLSNEQITKLPWDFGVVLQTYDNFGWIGDLGFFDWLKRKDGVLFRVDSSFPSVSTITHLPRGDLGDPNKVIEDVLKHLAKTRSNKRCPNSLIVSIPLHLSKQSIYRSIARQIDMHKTLKLKVKNPVDVEIPLYRFIARKLKTTTFKSSLKTLRTKIHNPDWPLWKVGLEAGLNENAAIEIRKAEAMREEIEKATGKRPKPDEGAYIEKMSMNTLANRQIKYALLLTENAARGRFPCIDPILDKDGNAVKLKVDYPFMKAEHEMADEAFHKRYPKPEIVSNDLSGKSD